MFFLSATGITALRAKPTLRYEFMDMHKKRALQDKRVLPGKLIEWGRCPAYEQQIIVGRAPGWARDRSTGNTLYCTAVIYT